MTKTMNRSAKLAGSAIALSIGLMLAGCGGIAQNRSVESVNQPVVERTNYALDVATGAGGLSYPEQRRVAGWFEAMDLRYGDRISIDDPMQSGATRAAVQDLAGKYGLLVSDEAPVTAGYVNAGTARIIITRSKATVPGCPNWSTQSDFNPKNGLSANYGCSVNGNLAAMVANPEHLLRGDNGTGETTIMSATKAIEEFRDASPSGGGGTRVNGESTK